MSDLRYAPASYTRDGKRVVFTDFQTATYQLRFDLGARRADVRSTIVFDTERRGLPLFELDAEPAAITARLDGKPVRCAEELVAGTTNAFQVLRKTVDPGRHVLEVEHSLHDLNADPPPLLWADEGVQCVFHMNDLDMEEWNQRFLGSYLPSNLEYDHYAMTMRVEVAGGCEPHALIANTGRQRPLEQGAGTTVWEVEHPSYFTTSFPWFDLLPVSLIEARGGIHRSVDGRTLPLFVYRLTDKDVGAELTRYVREVKTVLSDLEGRYGPFPHPGVTVRAMAEDFGGMEHAGATPSALGYLRHELDHSYFARGIAPANGHAGWMDEAIASWGDKGFPRCASKPSSPSSGLMSTSDYARATNENAYEQGALFLAYLDSLLAGKGGLTAFLRHYVDRKKYRSVSVEEFQRLLEAFAGRRLRSEFEEFVYRSEPPAGGEAPAPLRAGRAGVPARGPAHPCHAREKVLSAYFAGVPARKA